MSRSTDFTSIYRSIDSLATKFSELEDAYYDHLQKSQGENEAILAKQIDFSSEDYKSAVKEQTYVQNSVKQLTTIEKAYKTEVNQLKSSLQSFREEKASVPKNIIKELQRNIENSIKGLKQSVFSLDAVKSVEQRVGHKIQRYFEDTFQTVGQLFAEVPQLSKSHVQDVLGLSEIEDLCRRNTEALQNLESDMDAFQRITNSSFREIDKLARNLNDEHSSMQVNIEQTKEEVIRVLHCMRIPQKKSASEIDVNNIPSTLDHILGEAIAIEGKRNKIFANIKTHSDDISKSVKQHLKNNKKQLGALRTNNEILQSDLNMLTQNQYEAKVNIVSHSSGNTEDENKRTRKIQKLRVQTDLSPMSNRRHTPRESKDEKTSTTRSFASISPRDAREQFFLNTTREKHSTSQHELEINSTLLRDMQTLLETHMNSLKQKFDIFKNTAKSFVSSSGKVLKLVAKKGSEEEFTTKVYENDKKLFDTHLNALEGVINQGREKFDNLNEVINPSNPNSPTTRTTKTQSAKYSPKDIAHTKSPVSNSKKKSATKKKNTDRYRIQTLIQDFENKHGDLLKSPRDINASSRFEQQESLSAAVSRTMTVSKSQPDMSPGLKSVEFELILLQKRCEELDKERERMKDEVDHMKKQPIASELIPKLQALNDHNEKLSKDNAKLVKVAKKLENKASERKETIRKLYDMISEKEREINLYKNNNSSVLPHFVKQMETSIYQVESEMIIKYEKLRKDLQSKEKEISNLEELFSRFRQHSFVSKKSLPFSDFDPSRHPERYENEKGSIRDVNKDDLAILDQKRAQLEEVLSQVLSISHVPKLKSVINFLEEEKADINEKIKNSRSLLLEQINMSRDSKEYISEKKSLRESMKDPEDIRQKASILQAQVYGLGVEKKDLEERCSDLVNELEAAQKLRKTNERNYQDEVRVLNNKIQQLNDHIEDIETRTNEKLRSSLTGDKTKRFYSPGRLEISPTYHSSMDDFAHKQLQNEIKDIEARVKQMIENTGATNDNYNLLSTIEKLERLESAFKHREEKLLGKLKDISMREGELRVSEKNKVDASKLEEVNKNNTELQKIIDIYKKSVAESNEDNKKLSGIIMTKNQEIETLTKAVQERTNDNQALVDELKSLQEGVEKCESQYQEHIERLANVLLNYGLPVDSTETDLVIFGDNLVDLIDSTLEIVAKIKADFEEKTTTSVEEKEEAQEHIKKLEEENQELLDALEEMKGDLEKKDAEIEEVAEEKLNIEQQLEMLKKNVEEMEEEFKKVKKENKSLKEENDLVNEKERAIKEQQKKIGEMKSEYMRKVEEMNNNFWKETEQYNFKIQNQSKQNAKLKELLQNTANELTETKTQLAKGNRAIKELEESIQGKDSEIVSLQRNLDSMIMSIPPKNVMNEEKLMLEKQLEDYHSDLVEKDAYIEGLENDYKRQEQKLIKKEEEVDRLEEKIEELKSSIEMLTASNAELKEDTVRLEQENLEQKNAMIQNIDNLISDRDFLSIEIKNLKESVQQQSAKLQEKENEIRRITQVSERAQSELKEAIAKKDEEITILDKEFNILKGAILTTNETVHNLELEQERLKGLIIDLEQSNKALTEERDSLLVKIDALVKDSNEEKESIGAEISQYKRDLESAVKRIHEYEETAGHDKQRHEESIKAYELRVQELQNIIHEKDQHLDNRIKEMSTGENEIQELQLKVSRHESKHIDLENNILSLNSRIQKYESENETLDKLAKNLETETENLKTSLKSNENELKNADLKSQELESQISQTNLKINELEGQIADRQGQIEQLTAKLKLSDKEKSRLQEILIKKEEELKLKTDSLEELHDKKKELEVISNENLAELNQKTNSLVKELSEVKEENQSYRQQLEKKEEEIQGLTVLLSQKEAELKEEKVVKEELENVLGEMRVKQADNESEIESLKVQVASFERAVSVLNDKNNALNEENTLKENELEDLRIKIDANKEDHYREEVRRLENELNELKTSFVQKENEIEENRAQKEKEHLEAIQNLQKSLSEKEELSKQMTQRIQTLETNLKEILLENGKLQSEVEEENKKALNENVLEIEKLNTKIIELESAIEISRQSETTIRGEFVELQTQNQDLGQSISLKEKEIERLKDTLREKEAQHKESSEKYENDLGLSDSKLQELEKELNSIKTLNEDLMAKVLNYDEEFRTLRASIVDKEQELLDLESIVEEKEKIVAALEEKIRASEDQAAKIKEAADTNEKGIEQMRLENAKYEVELQTANSKINEVEKEMNKLNNELSEQKKTHDEEYTRISTSLKEKENELFSSQRGLEAKENELQSLREEIIARESEISEGKERINTIEKELDELRLEKAKYQDKVENANNEMKKLEEELQKVKDLTTNLVAKIQNYDETSQTLNTTLQEKDNTIAHIQTDLENRNKEIETLRGEISVSQEQIVQLNDKLNANGKEVEKMKQENSGLKSEVETVRQQLEGLNIALAEKERENVSYKQAFTEEKTTETDNFKRQLLEIENQLINSKEKASSLEVEVQKEKEDNSNMRTQLETMQAKIQAFEKTIAELEKVNLNDKEIVNQNTVEIEDLTARLTSSQDELTSANTKISELETEIQDLAKECEKLREDVQSKSDQNSNVLSQLMQKEKEFFDLRTEFDALSAELNQKASHQEGQTETTSQEATKLQEELEVLKKEINELKEANERKEEEISQQATYIAQKEYAFQHEMGDLADENDRLRKEMEEREEQYNDDMREFSNALFEIKQAVTDKDEELGHRDHEIEQLRLKLEDYEKKLLSPDRKHGRNSAKSSHQDRPRTFDDLEIEDKEKRDELAAKCEKLEKEKKSRASPNAEPQIEKLEKELEETREALQNKTREFAEVKANSVVEIGRVRLEYQEHINQLNDENEALKDRSRELIQEYEDLQADYDSLKSTKDLLQLENSHLTNEIGELNKKVDNCKDQIRELREKRDQLTTKLKEIDLGIGSPVAASGSEKKKKKKKKHDQDQGQNNEENDVEQMKANIAEYERQIEKLKKERKDVMESHINLKDENKQLRQTMQIFQEQIVMLNQNKKSENSPMKPKKETNVQHNEIVDAIEEGLGSLRFLKPFQGRIESRIEDGNGVRRLFEQIKTAVNNYENLLSRAAQSSVDSLQVQRAKMDYDYNIQALTNTMIQKLFLIKTEVINIVRECEIEAPSFGQDPLARKDLNHEEEIIYSSLNLIKKHLKYLEGKTSQQKLWENTELDRDQSLVKIESDVPSKGPMIPSIQLPLINLKSASPVKRESEEEKHPAGFYTSRRRESQNEQSSSIQEDLEDIKGRSFLKESYDLDKLPEEKDEAVQQKNQMQALYIQIRMLQDENEKLELEYKQLKNDFESLKFLNEDLQAELQDKDERIKKMLGSVMGPGAGVRSEEEKEHLKGIFLRFLDSALQGLKEAEDLLRVLLTLLGIPEQERNQLIAGFKAKTAAKKGIFSKIFK